MAAQFLMIPAMALVKVSQLIATKGTAEAVKKFGKNAVRAAKKYFDPVKMQKMKTGKGRGTPGNVKNMEDAFVKFSKPIGTKSKSGLENMSMQKVTKEEGQKLLRQGLARKATLGTIASATAGTFAASGDKKEKEDKQGISGIKDDIKRFNAKRTTLRQDSSSRTNRPASKPASDKKDNEFAEVKDNLKSPPMPKDKPKRGPKNIESRLKAVSDKRKAEKDSAKESEDVKRRRKSQLKKPKGRAESLKEQLLVQGKREYDTPLGKVVVDSTDEGMDTDRANFKYGGTAFGKGGMYKGTKKTYGMRKGGFTNRGQMS